MALNILRVHGTKTPRKVPRRFLLSEEGGGPETKVVKTELLVLKKKLLEQDY